MKKILLSVTTALFVLSMTSCRKCTECIAYSRTTNMPQTTENYCGPKRSIKVYESNFITFHTTSTTYAQCK